MERAEKIQKLCLKMNVTEVEADAALRACGDDILDAALYLEALGRVRMPSGGFYAETPTDGRADAQAPVRRASESFGEVIRKFFRWCLHVIRKGMDNYLEVRKDGETKFRLPITIAVIAALVCFPVTVALLIIGLFCDFQYHFAGPDISEKFVGNTAAAGCSNVATSRQASATTATTAATAATADSAAMVDSVATAVTAVAALRTKWKFRSMMILITTTTAAAYCRKQ